MIRQREDKEMDRRQKILWRLIAIGFALLLATSIGFSVISIYSIGALSNRVDSRDAFVEYINKDSQWNHCQDKEDREFFIVIGDLISASLARDRDRISQLTHKLEQSRDNLQNAENPAVCGPPPSVPDKIGNP